MSGIRCSKCKRRFYKVVSIYEGSYKCYNCYDEGRMHSGLYGTGDTKHRSSMIKHRIRKDRFLWSR